MHPQALKIVVFEGPAQEMLVKHARALRQQSISVVREREFRDDVFARESSHDAAVAEFASVVFSRGRDHSRAGANRLLRTGACILMAFSDVSQPLKLYLTREGMSTVELVGHGLERWRAGLGF